MFRALKTVIELFWIADIINLPFMEIFDTTYTLNGWFWTITLVILAVEESFENKIIKVQSKNG